MALRPQRVSVDGLIRPPSETDVPALAAKTATAGGQGQFERFKTSHDFDGTVRSPQWPR